MKTFKRFSAILIAVFLMVSMMVIPASAATHSITIKNASTHTFTAYQIFSGTQSGNILSDIVWGNGVDSANLLQALKDDVDFGTTFDSCGDAEDVSDILEQKTWTEANTIAFAKIVANNLAAGMGKTGNASGTNYVIDRLDPGYYIVLDTTALESGANDAYSRYIVTVTDNTDISIKNAVPTLKKNVSLTEGSGFGPAVSAGIGNTVYFSLTAQMHARVGDYADGYDLEFIDTLPTGLTYEEVVAVYVNNTLLRDGENPKTSDVDYTPDADKHTFAVDNVNEIISAATGGAAVSATDRITIVYSATINGSNWNYGENGNKNSAVLRFSNSPANPGSMGQTDAAYATIYTYQMTVTKQDSVTHAKLANAEFYIHFVDDEGNIKFIEAGAPADNNVYTAINTHVATTDGDGKVVVPSKATAFKTDDNGVFTIQGLREREYHLTEKTAPESYNKIPDADEQHVNIDATLENGALKELSATKIGTYITSVSAAKATGTVSVTVINHQGAVLPSTGGIGTTVFYGIGGVLVIGALSLLIVRKRTTAK